MKVIATGTLIALPFATAIGNHVEIAQFLDSPAMDERVTHTSEYQRVPPIFVNNEAQEIEDISLSTLAEFAERSIEQLIAGASSLSAEVALLRQRTRENLAQIETWIEQVHAESNQNADS